VAALLRDDAPLPTDYRTWLAGRLADVAQVLLDGRNAKPDAAVMTALGARRPQQRGSQSVAKRDQELAERAEFHRGANPGRPWKAIYQDVADEWPLWAAALPPEWRGVEEGERVSWRVVKEAHEKRRR
jgi:hypothetical protein